MFARLASVFIALVVATGAAADDCTNVCCTTAQLVSRGVICCWVVLTCARPGPDWLAGNRMLEFLSRATVCLQHVLLYLCE